jgi:hypothetical protein
MDEFNLNSSIHELGICYFSGANINGCTDPSACNYEADATADDGSCDYDFDYDGVCDNEDIDDDNDGVADSEDYDENNPFICSDSDGDSCDDCSNGYYDPNNDGSDYDGDGICDLGDDDDDNDGVPDGDDCDPQNEFASDLDECGVCGGDGIDCNDNIFECVSDCPNYDEISEDLGNDSIVCGFLEEGAWNNDCSEDCDFDFWYLASNECDWECTIWENQDECQSYGCIWDDTNFACVNWPYYTECEEIYDEAFDLGLEEGILLGAQSGDVNGDGVLNVIDVVVYINMILNP